jgi:ornithine carbamoyltransferase
MKHFISLEKKYFSAQEANKLLSLCFDVKNNPRKYRLSLKDKSIGLIFEKPSLRTKTSFYVGASKLDADPVYYAPNEVQLGGREKSSDVAKVLSRYLDAIVLRTFEHKNVLELAEYADVPVINGLSDFLHPSQILGDLITIAEKKGDIKKIKFAYIGDGNNVCNSLLLAFSLLGGKITVATPVGYAPDKAVMQEAGDCAKESGAQIYMTNSAQEAASKADVLYTDVWTSMGMETERQGRKDIFKSYQINDEILRLAKNDAIVMHCLPAHRGEEITDSVIDGKNSVVFDQAENRLYSAQAILLYTQK